ncbi:MAG: hypothetical protein ACNYWM_12545, partial [Methanosarcinales archaeon]
LRPRLSKEPKIRRFANLRPRLSKEPKIRRFANLRPTFQRNGGLQKPVNSMCNLRHKFIKEQLTILQIIMSNEHI